MKLGEYQTATAVKFICKSQRKNRKRITMKKSVILSLFSAQAKHFYLLIKWTIPYKILLKTKNENNSMTIFARGAGMREKNLDFWPGDHNFA